MTESPRERAGSVPTTRSMTARERRGVRAMLPGPLRNRLAALIVEAFHDPAARRRLEALAPASADSASRPRRRQSPATLFRAWLDDGGGRGPATARWTAHADELGRRAERAAGVLRARPLDPVPVSRAAALAGAGALFDARLYFEAHELLEAHWRCAEGRDREVLQGLIQVAVGLQHLADGNAAGARSLLRAGGARLGAGDGSPALDSFARAIAGCLAAVGRLHSRPGARFDWRLVPPFPAGR